MDYRFHMLRLQVLFVVVSVLALPTLQKNLNFEDLSLLADELNDGVFGRKDSSEFSSTTEIENVPHPMIVNNWAGELNVGQISGVAVNPDDQPVIFQRGPVVWDQKSFDGNHVLRDQKVIDEDTILVLDSENGSVLNSWGKGRFYMPHGLTIDSRGNVYVTDVGLHQVMRFPVGSHSPDLVLGKAFEPKNSDDGFCQPTSVAVVDSTGEFFVADGYCNSRVLKFDKEGNLIKILDGDWKVVHSLSLFEDDDVLCLADREGQTIECVSAGLRRPFGQEIVSFDNVGRVYAIAAKGSTLAAVAGAPHPTGLTIDTSGGRTGRDNVVDTWGMNVLTDPHDLAISNFGDAIYVAEVDPTKSDKLHKFEVINLMEEDDEIF